MGFLLLRKRIVQDWRAFIHGAADELFAELVSLRRHLHQHPELSGHEFETARTVAAWLDEREVSGRLVADGRGIVSDLRPGNAEDLLCLRADMDALQIQDIKNVPYCSSVPQVMHACGHDVHTTMLAGSLTVLHRLGQAMKRRFPVRGIFQPAEEICIGASQMIAENVLAGVRAALAFHVDPFRHIGTIAYRPGVMAASCDELIIQINGKGGHAARPHHTHDPITAAAQFLNAVHVQVPRGTDSLDTVVVGFGMIRGGEQCNVVPDSVQLRGTLRTLTRETRHETLQRIHEIADAIGNASRTRIEVKIGASTPAVTNDEALSRLAATEINELPGDVVAEEMKQPSMGGEDFAYYLEKVPGILLRLGTGTPGVEPTGLHTPAFDVDEEVLRKGVILMASMAVSWSDQYR